MDHTAEQTTDAENTTITKWVKPYPMKVFKDQELSVEPYLQQRKRWPKYGHHIIGTFTDTAILVYQAFNHKIADYAIEHQHFGGPDFSPTRMTWIKPNFLWMMYRSNWARSHNQERILGIWLKLDAFHEILQLSEQTNANENYQSKESWQKARASPKTLPGSTERWNGKINVQWDPDHTPTGSKLPRRAIQIGIKMLPWWADGSKFEGIIDMTDFVKSQRAHADSGAWDELVTPHERIYVIPDADIASHSRCDSTQSDVDQEAEFLRTQFPS